MFKKLTKTGKLGPYPFQSVLRDMLKEVGMRPRLARIVEYRNALIHSGGLRLRQTNKHKAYVETQRLIREYLLRLLGYSGRYRNYEQFGAPSIL
jgi:hypothetical protein